MKETEQPAAHNADQIASPKGLVVGLQDSDQPETIPTKIDGKDLSGLRWILVVEKEVSHHLEW